MECADCCDLCEDETIGKLPFAVERLERLATALELVEERLRSGVSNRLTRVGLQSLQQYVLRLGIPEAVHGPQVADGCDVVAILLVGLVVQVRIGKLEGRRHSDERHEHRCGEPQSPGCSVSHAAVPDFDRGVESDKFAFAPCAVCIGYAGPGVHRLTVVMADIPNANLSRPENLAMFDAWAGGLANLTQDRNSA